MTREQFVPSVNYLRGRAEFRPDGIALGREEVVVIRPEQLVSDIGTVERGAIARCKVAADANSSRLLLETALGT